MCINDHIKCFVRDPFICSAGICGNSVSWIIGQSAKQPSQADMYCGKRSRTNLHATMSLEPWLSQLETCNPSNDDKTMLIVGDWYRCTRIISLIHQGARHVAYEPWVYLISSLKPRIRSYSIFCAFACLNELMEVEKGF